MGTGKLPLMPNRYMKKYKRALLFGTFDPLHFGHLRLIRRASQIAQQVYICVDSDQLIRTTKNREPFTPLKERLKDLEMIKGIGGIGVEGLQHGKDYWVKKFKPDVLVKGDDWKGKGWSGERLGVKVKYFPYTKEISSTQIRYGLGISLNKRV
jgi:glycerol-3-phosphate cytidylyltransferase